MATAGSHNHSGRVLIVEDETIIAQDVSDGLTRLGYEVCAIVTSGEQALEATSRFLPDIALMDIKLKGRMDGIEAAEILGKRHEIPVIFLTAHADDTVLQRAKHTDPFGYITKPFSERDLSVAMEIAIARIAAWNQIRKAEAALRASETRMRAIVETAVDAIVTIDEHGTVQSFNLSAERIFGYAADEVVGGNVALLMPEAHQLRHDRYIRAYLETGVAKIIGIGREVEGRRKDGVSVPLELAIASWSVDSRRYFTGTMRDIAARKHMEEELRLRNAELARINARLDQFVHIVGHDLRAPMRALSNSALWIIEDLGEAANVEIRGHAQRISDSRIRMCAMLDDLREYSRAGLDPAPPQQVDFREIVAEIQSHVPTNAAAAITIAGPVFACVIRRAAIDIVFRNLIENAIRHTDRDQVAISIGCEEAGDHLRFSVCDDGPGIPPDYHIHIFNPFAKIVPGGARSGSGMGLTLVKRVVEDNGGTISIESDPPARRGTCFLFTWAKQRRAVVEA